MRIGFNEHIAGPKLTFGSGNESYLSGSFRSHAKRSQKTAHRVWQSKPDALRWHLFAAPVFDSDWFQESSRERCSVGPTQQPLHRGRTVVGDHLSADSRSRTDRDLAPVASQWSVSIPEWSDALSECHYAETISVAHRTPSLASAASAPRSLSGPDECQAAPAQALDFRFGLHSADRLRETRSRRCWLPSVQARTQVVPSAALFRRANERLLARGTASRSCLYRRRSSSAAGSLFCQAARWPQTGYHPRGQGFLRPQDHRLAGAKKSSLCDRRQTDSGRQAAALRLALPPSWRERFDCPVLLPAIRIEKALPLCSSATTPNRRDERPTG